MQFPAGNEDSIGIRRKNENETQIIMNIEHC